MGSALLFILSTTLSAALLFVVQPMLGRFVLPWFGGGATVWTICMLFFQSALLLGYAYAHLLAMRLPPRRGILLHLGLVATTLLTLPIIPSPPTEAGDPTLGILGVLASVGAPYLVLSATAPLLQAWAARVASDRSPYGLYAWSNAGSLTALLGYPILLEPYIGLHTQAIAWSVTFGVWTFTLAGCGWLTWRAGEAPLPEEVAGPPPTWGDRIIWISTTALASTILLATTDLISEDVSAAPLLWVIPLALYLLSFILCFGSPRWSARVIWMPLLIPALLAQWWAYGEGAGAGLITIFMLYSAGLFISSMVLHGELVRARPAANHLTGFYLASSLGGAIGGILVGVVAPRALDVRAELLIAMVILPALVLWAVLRSRPANELRSDPRWLFGILALILAGFGYGLWGETANVREATIWMRRGFYGVLRIREHPAKHLHGPSRRLLHGHIMHGLQFTDERHGDPVSYYGPNSGVGLLLAMGRDGPPRQIGVIGLGIGTIAAFARPIDHVVFYEISPDVAYAAQTFFTHLSTAGEGAEIRLGDARRTLITELDEPRYDILVLDAFSGDAIPAHLLTQEAFLLYLKRLKPNGVIAANVSNRHLELRPILIDHAEKLGLKVAVVTSKAVVKKAINRARWVLLSRDSTARNAIWAAGELDQDWTGGTVTWTDDFTPLLPLIKTLRK